MSSYSFRVLLFFGWELNMRFWVSELVIRIEPATPTPKYFQPNAYPSMLVPQVLIEGSLTSILFVNFVCRA